MPVSQILAAEACDNQVFPSLLKLPSETRSIPIWKSSLFCWPVCCLRFRSLPSLPWSDPVAFAGFSRNRISSICEKYRFSAPKSRTSALNFPGSKIWYCDRPRLRTPPRPPNLPPPLGRDNRAEAGCCAAARCASVFSARGDCSTKARSTNGYRIDLQKNDTRSLSRTFTTSGSCAYYEIPRRSKTHSSRVPCAFCCTACDARLHSPRAPRIPPRPMLPRFHLSLRARPSLSDFVPRCHWKSFWA